MTKSMTELQDSYDALTPSASKDSKHLIGYQEDTQLQQQQKQSSKMRSGMAPIDLRDVYKQKEQQKRLE